MIYTVTLNPALDYHVYAEKLCLGEVIRARRVGLSYGGKGINVSALLTRLGLPATALGFVAGATGEMLCRSLEQEGILQDFIFLKEGATRINVKIHVNSKDTDLNAPGPEIDPSSQEELLRRMRGLKEGDALVLSGSIPPCLPRDFYRRLMEGLPPRVLVAVDTEGECLRAVLPLRPFLVKPNLSELSSLVGYSCDTPESLIRGARELRDWGAQNVLVSLGGEGALLLDASDRLYRQDAPSGTVIQTVGCGDAMLAGFLANWLKSGDSLESLRYAVSCGSASAFSERLAEEAQIQELYNKMATEH